MICIQRRLLYDTKLFDNVNLISLMPRSNKSRPAPEVFHQYRQENKSNGEFLLDGAGTLRNPSRLLFSIYRDENTE